MVFKAFFFLFHSCFITRIIIYFFYNTQKETYILILCYRGFVGSIKVKYYTRHGRSRRIISCHFKRCTIMRMILFTQWTLKETTVHVFYFFIILFVEANRRHGCCASRWSRNPFFLLLCISIRMRWISNTCGTFRAILGKLLSKIRKGRWQSTDCPFESILNRKSWEKRKMMDTSIFFLVTMTVTACVKSSSVTSTALCCLGSASLNQMSGFERSSITQGWCFWIG